VEPDFPKTVFKSDLAPFAVLVPLAAAVRLWVAWADQGIIWPDEIFQTIEAGHRLAFGYGFRPWEFQDGARSWLFPGLLGGVLKVASLLGATTGESLVHVAKAFMALVGAAGVWATMRAARHLGGSAAAVWAGVLATFFPPWILFGGRCMTEIASEAVLAGALALLLAPRNVDGRLRAAGALAGLSIFLRYQNGLVAAGFMVLAFSRGGGRGVRRFVEGAALSVAFGAALDWATWGGPLRPLLVYLRFNFAEASSRFGQSSFWHYGELLWKAGTAGTFLATAGLLWAVRSRGRDVVVLVATLALYLLVHSLMGHKELRFLIPTSPIAFAVAGTGLAALIERLDTASRRSGWLRGPAWLGVFVPAAAAAIALAAMASDLRLGALGYDDRPEMADLPVWKHRDSFDRLLWRAGAAPDLCGLLVVGPGPIWLGGFTYLHRDVPYEFASPRALADGWPDSPQTANYVLLDRGLPAPPQTQLVADIEGVTLHRRDGSCQPSPTPPTRDFKK
jgi:hypothetical protein